MTSSHYIAQSAATNLNSLIKKHNDHTGMIRGLNDKISGLRQATNITDLRSDQNNLKDSVSYLSKGQSALTVDVKKLTNDIQVLNAKINCVLSLTQTLMTASSYSYAAHTGDILLSVDDATNPEDLTAADLNAATSYATEVEISVQDSNGGVHTWANIEPVISAVSATFNDVDITDPTVKYRDDIVATPKFVNGKMILRVTWDVDAGATKTYQAGDTMSFDIDISAGGTWHEATVAQITKTYNFI